MSLLQAVIWIGAAVLVARVVVRLLDKRRIRRSDAALAQHIGEVMARNGVTHWKPKR